MIIFTVVHYLQAKQLYDEAGVGIIEWMQQLEENRISYTVESQ